MRSSNKLECVFVPVYARVLSSIASLYKEVGIPRWLVQESISRGNMFRMLYTAFITCNRQRPAPTKVGNKCCIMQVEVYLCLLLSVSCSMCILLGLQLLISSFLLGHLLFIFLLLLLHIWARKLSAHVWALLQKSCSTAVQQRITSASSDMSEQSRNKVWSDLSHACSFQRF